MAEQYHATGFIMDKKEKKMRNQIIKEKEQEAAQEVFQEPVRKKSLWDRIKEFFKNLRDQITIMMLPRSTKRSLDRQMELSMTHSIKEQEEKIKVEKEQMPKRIYNRFLAPECERSRFPVQTRIQELAYNMLAKDDCTIRFPDGHKLDIIPDAESLRTVFHIYDAQGNLEHADEMQFIRKKGEYVADIRNSDIRHLSDLLEDKSVFHAPSEVQEQIKEKVAEAEIKEQVPDTEPEYPEENRNPKQDYSERYHSLVQKFNRNPFLMDLKELEEMVTVLVAGKLDRDDEKKFSRSLTIRPFDKTQEPVKIKASWNKDDKCVTVSYLKGNEEITREQAQEAFNNAKSVRYTIPSWESEKLEQKEQSVIPQFQMNRNQLYASLSQAVTASREDLIANYGHDLPSEAISDIDKAMREGNLAKMQEWYECLSFMPSENVSLQFPRTEQVTSKMMEISSNDGIAIQYPESTACSIIHHEYIDRLNSFPFESEKWTDFLKEQNTEYVHSMNALAPEDKTELNYFLKGDIDRFIESLQIIEPIQTQETEKISEEPQFIPENEDPPYMYDEKFLEDDETPEEPVYENPEYVEFDEYLASAQAEVDMKPKYEMSYESEYYER